MYNPIRDLWGLLYPELCVTCRRPLVGGERTLCTWCLHDMPVVDCKDYRNNVLSELFDGLIPIRYAAALFHYRKGSRYHALLHQLKYGGRPDIGYSMGQYIGARLRTSPLNGADVIVPVPLHPKRQRQRGYNQSEYIARGIAEALQKPVDVQSLIRTVPTCTQTHSGRWDRFDNVSGIFALNQDNTLENKHIVLVDDVVTTGATLYGCAGTLLQVPGIGISIVAIAVAAE